MHTQRLINCFSLLTISSHCPGSDCNRAIANRRESSRGREDSGGAWRLGTIATQTRRKRRRRGDELLSARMFIEVAHSSNCCRDCCIAMRFSQRLQARSARSVELAVACSSVNLAARFFSSLCRFVRYLAHSRRSRQRLSFAKARRTRSASAFISNQQRGLL